MAARPWESRLMEQSLADPAETTPLTKCCADTFASARPKSSEPNSVKVKRNNVTTRISAKPPMQMAQVTHSSSPSSDFRYDESSASSSLCTSTTPASGNTHFTSDKTEESGYSSRPSYMNLTESTKAKQRINSHLSHRIQRQSMDEFQFLKKSAAFSNGDAKSSAGSDPAVNFSKPFYLPTRLDKSSTKQKERGVNLYD